MSQPNIPLLDHIIILVPYKDLSEPQEWVTKNFKLTPGGRHADGKTENNLIIFQDGSYVELIAFVNDDPKNREGHWWGDRDFGIIDFAFTTNGPAKENYEALMERALDVGLKVEDIYAPPVAGGRSRPDGEELKWEVTFPRGVGRGEMPFFCHDVTDRSLRVPKQNMTHPCNATSVSHVHVSLPKQKVRSIHKAYEALLGPGKECALGEEHTIYNFAAGNVVSSDTDGEMHVTLQTAHPRDAGEQQLTEERGVLLGLTLSTTGSPVRIEPLPLQPSGMNINLAVG